MGTILGCKIPGFGGFWCTKQKTTMTMENQPFEDVSPTKHGDFPLTC